jgi:hypothetical protein
MREQPREAGALVGDSRGFHPKGVASRRQSPVGNGSAGEMGERRDKCDCEGVQTGAMGLTLRVDNSQANRVDNYGKPVPAVVQLGRSN